jgi:hypothetical protein
MPRQKPDAPRNNPHILYNVARTYRDFPQNEADQRELVGMVYSKVHAQGGKIPVSEAKKSRIYYIAKELHAKANQFYDGLSDVDRMILTGLEKVRSARSDEMREAQEEKLCIQIEHVDNSEISDFVESVAVQVRGHGLRFYEQKDKSV